MKRVSSQVGCRKVSVHRVFWVRQGLGVDEILHVDRIFPLSCLHLSFPLDIRIVGVLVESCPGLGGREVG